MLTVENKDGITLAYLNNLTEAKVHEVLNGEYTLSFVAVIEPLKTDCLYNADNLINYADDLFRVVTLEELHDEDDSLTVSVECEHISYDLINNVMNDFNYTNSMGSSVMTQCLLDTDFTLRNCDITEKTDIQYTKECNSKQISIAIANNWHGELKYYRYYIDLLKSRGQNRGTGFIFGRNLKSVKRIINRAENTTSYEVEIVQGSELEELGYYELGDTVRVMDERLNIDYYCKIIEIEKDILTGINGKVVLEDAIKDMRSSFSSVRKDLTEVKEIITSSSPSWDKVAEIVDNSGNIILGKLNALTNIATKIINSTGTFYQEDGCSCWQDQPTFAASTFATKWSAQGLVFANSKKNNNTEWDWQTAIDANGVVATSVTSSCLSAITANITSVIAGTLTGQTINGCTLKGGEIWIGTNIPDNPPTSGTMGTFTGVRITTNGVINGYRNGKNTYFLTHSAEGKLVLNDYTSNANLTLDSHTGSLYRNGGALQLFGGVQTEGGSNGSYIKIEENGDIYIVANGGRGTVYINGEAYSAS